MGEYQHLTLSFPPIYDKYSDILILGSFPSVQSRQQEFYYGNPQNRFWTVLAHLYACEIPTDIEQKKNMLLQSHVAVWDVIQECDIIGSGDSSIKNVTVNLLNPLLQDSRIRRIYANGRLAANLYQKYTKQETGRDITALPSTSPANAAYSVDRLLDAWKVIRDLTE